MNWNSFNKPSKFFNMKTKLLTLLTFFSLVSITLTHAQESTLGKDVRELLDQYGNAVGSKSFSKMADCFHDDAMILPEGKPIVKGRKEIIESFKWFESLDFAEQFIIEEVIMAGEYSIARTRNIGSWKDPKTAESGNFEVKGLLILKPDQNGDLKIYRYMFNNNGK